MLPCIWSARMPHYVTCIISNSWHEIFIHHVNISPSMHRHKIFTHCMLFNYQGITRKRSLNWDLNQTRHHLASTLRTHNKKKNFFLFFFSKSKKSLLRRRLLSRQPCRTTWSDVSRVLCARSGVSCSPCMQSACRALCTHD